MYRLQHRVLHTGSANDPPRSRGPRITTQREDMYMMTSSHREVHDDVITPSPLHTRDNFLQRLRQATRTRLSVYTDRNRPRAARLRAQRPYIGVPLTQRHRVASTQPLG